MKFLLNEAELFRANNLFK